MQDKLPNTRLPTGLQVLGYFFYLNSVTEDCGKQNVIPDVVADVMNHWISCNIYTTSKRSVKNKLEKLVNTYNSLKKTPQKKKGPTFASSLNNFSKLCEGLFEIRCTDKNRLSNQETLWNVKETDKEKQFYEGQCKIPQVRFSF